MKLSKNTLLIHVPQHAIFLLGILTILLGNVSAWWLLASYIGWIIIGYFGFSVWYHRYFAHRSFETYRVWEYVWGYLGLLVGRGDPINLASLHCAEHHPYADKDNDPHSPKDGILHSWVTWGEYHTFKPSIKHIKHLVKDPFIRFLGNHYFKIIWGTFLLLFLIDWRIAVFGMMGAGVLHYHIEGGFVSTFCHLPKFGKQDNPTNDNSRNIRGILNYITLGTGLHNNHHARPWQYHYEIFTGDFDLARYIVPLFIKK